MTESLERSTARGGRLIAGSTLFVVAAITIPPWFPTVAGGGRSERTAALAGMSDSIDPEYVQFVEMVGEATGPDRSIVIVVPPELGGPQSAWYPYRAEWILAGREVTPFFDPLTRKPVPERIENADLLLFWKLEPNLENLEIVMRRGDGILLRKR